MGKVLSHNDIEDITPEPSAPMKHYEWQPGDMFQLTGEEYSAVINGLRQASIVIETLFAEGIKSGVIKEKVVEDKKEDSGPIKSTDIIEGIPLP